MALKLIFDWFFFPYYSATYIFLNERQPDLFIFIFSFQKNSEISLVIAAKVCDLWSFDQKYAPKYTDFNVCGK